VHRDQQAHGVRLVGQGAGEGWHSGFPDFAQRGKGRACLKAFALGKNARKPREGGAGFWTEGYASSAKWNSLARSEPRQNTASV
jgi:hypothetical protein